MFCPKFIRSITVEPVILCFFSALIVFSVTNTAVVYEAICEQKYGTAVWVDCRPGKLAQTHHEETQVQKEAAQWTMYFNLAGLVPIIFVDIVLGSWGDKVGRKINILLGITGVCIVHVNALMLATNHLINLALLFPLTITACLSGYIALIPISCSAYLSDITIDKDILTQKLVLLGVCAGLAGIVGGLGGGVLLARLPFEWVLFISQSCLVLTYFYTVVRLKQIPPAVIKRKKFVKQQSAAPLSTTNASMQSFEDMFGQETLSTDDESGLFKEVWTLLKDAGKTYVKHRPGKARSYMVLSGIIYTLFMSVEFALRSQIVSLYLFAAPFEWSPAQLSFFRAAQALVSIVGQLAGVLLAKRVLRLSDTTMILIGMVSLTAEMIMLGLAKNVVMMGASAILGVFSGLAIPSMQSFMARLVEPNEVGKAFTVFGIAADVAFISGIAVYNNVYSATVAWMPGFTFLFVAALSMCCFLMFLWVHVNYIRERNVLLKSI